MSMPNPVIHPPPLAASPPPSRLISWLACPYDPASPPCTWRSALARRYRDAQEIHRPRVDQASIAGSPPYPQAPAPCGRCSASAKLVALPSQRQVRPERIFVFKPPMQPSDVLPRNSRIGAKPLPHPRRRRVALPSGETRSIESFLHAASSRGLRSYVD